MEVTDQAAAADLDNAIETPTTEPEPEVDAGIEPTWD
jgi:hypothetical protein